jgi:hypothetical protein
MREEQAFVDFTLEEKDLRGLRYILGMGLSAFRKLDSEAKREAVRVGVKVLKILNPVAREIEREVAP